LKGLSKPVAISFLSDGGSQIELLLWSCAQLSLFTFKFPRCKQSKLLDSTAQDYKKTSVFIIFFFLLNLFAPLNGIQQIEDTYDTPRIRFFYLLFMPYGHKSCVTQPCQHGDFV
jgi:hypothetical protein